MCSKGAIFVQALSHLQAQFNFHHQLILVSILNNMGIRFSRRRPRIASSPVPAPFTCLADRAEPGLAGTVTVGGGPRHPAGYSNAASPPQQPAAAPQPAEINSHHVAPVYLLFP